ncbi:MAG: arginine deiminase family protein [Thermomicrobiales bacterium]
MLEGGDCLWVDDTTLAIGRGYRTNDSGIDQMTEIMAEQGVTVIRVGLPHWNGPAECLHLLSLISMIDEDLAVVHLPLLDVGFIEILRERDIEFVEIPENEFVTQAPNVLVTAPRKCIMLRENPLTAAKLQQAGCEVTFYTGNEISTTAPAARPASPGRSFAGAPSNYCRTYGGTGRGCSDDQIAYVFRSSAVKAVRRRDLSCPVAHKSVMSSRAKHPTRLVAGNHKLRWPSVAFPASEPCRRAANHWLLLRHVELDASRGSA